jgi:hypothetical protein
MQREEAKNTFLATLWQPERQAKVRQSNQQVQLSIVEQPGNTCPLLMHQLMDSHLAPICGN